MRSTEYLSSCSKETAAAVTDLQVTICAQKLVRAEKLIGGLGGEKDRWNQAATDLQTIYDNLLGDVLISAGVIAYLGPFTTAFREKCTTSWVCLCKVRRRASGCVIEWRICNREVAGSNLGRATSHQGLLSLPSLRGR